MLVIIACVAEINFYIQNRDFIFVGRLEYISSVSSRVPNLFFISIPSQAIILASAFFSPFKSKRVNILLKSFAMVIFIISILQGYRHWLLIVFVFLFSVKYKRIGVVLCLLFASFSGDITLIMKKIILSVLYDEKFILFDYLDYISENISDFIGFSGEQKAIVSNFVTGFDSLNYNAYIDSLNLFPLLRGLDIGVGQETASRLGILTGAGLGEGTGYNFHLFVYETFGFALVLMALIIFTIKKTYQTPLFFLSIEIFYSMLRNSPAFWTGQLKMLLVLFAMVFFLNSLYKLIIDE
ncbi:hypothetical protein AB4529_19720 [Vibrio splendidus]